MPITDLWPQIATGISVSICSGIVTLIIRKTAKRLENVATKDFVNDALEKQDYRIGQMFVKASTQQIVNADLEARLRRVEDAFGVRLRGVNFGADPPPNPASQ